MSFDTFPSPTNSNEKTTYDQTYFGEKFKESLYKAKEAWEDPLRQEGIMAVAGEEYLEAAKNKGILMDALSDISNMSEVPEKIKHAIRIYSSAISDYDPTPERFEYEFAVNEEEKNNLARKYNEKLIMYSSSIRNLFQVLEEILPIEMVEELRHRDGMFLQPIEWAANQNPLS